MNIKITFHFISSFDYVEDMLESSGVIFGNRVSYSKRNTGFHNWIYEDLEALRRILNEH